MPNQLQYLSADKTNTLPWKNELGSSTDIYNSPKQGSYITPNDSLYTDDTGSASTYEAEIDNQNSSSNCKYLTLYVRAKKSASAGRTRTLTVNLVVNSINVVTVNFSDAELVGGWLTKWTSVMGDWTQAQINAGYVQCTTTYGGTGAGRKVYVSAIHVLSDTGLIL